MDYNDIVETDEQTCGACPTQWEGTLKDGRPFYFRYRWGNASLGVGEDPVMSPNTVNRQFGDRLDGVMDDETYRAVFMELWALHELTHHWGADPGKVIAYLVQTGRIELHEECDAALPLDEVARALGLEVPDEA